MSAAHSGTFSIGGDLPVHRLGYGAMQITGDGVWGPPADRDQSLAVLRRAVDLGITLIDTADSYGPFVSEDLIAEALHPYPDDLVVATKGGLTRTGPGKWHAVGRPMYLRQCLEMSLRRLKTDRIDLYQLHRIDAQVPLEDQLGVLKEMQDEGKIRHLGLSEVSVDEIKAAREHIEVTTVQNLYNLGDRRHEDVVDYCEREGIGFIPWYPLNTGKLLQSDDSSLAQVAADLDATPAQVALAWLLKRSPVMLPIPGTSKVAHLEQNTAAAELEVSDDVFVRLESASHE
jgi:aryl-alcohol dehydrogenase-like predicted oxidoreductase